MAYFPPRIDQTGMHIPEYADIRDDLLMKYRGIFGNDVYLENDSQDYQFISIIALAMHDSLLACQQAYNARSPRTSSGVVLDGVVAINGINRKKESNTVVMLKLFGEPQTIIADGLAGDEKGNTFRLPNTVTLDNNGESIVKAICIQAGAIEALPNTIQKIVTPTKGWTAVTNPDQGLTGQALETDAQLRSRQMISTANPSRTILQGTIGAIAAVKGVKRYRVYENDTSITDVNGIPSHTISPIVEGGDDDEIAKVIYLHKGTGGGTFGNIAVIVPATITGEEPTTIQFWRPTYINVNVEITIKKLQGYTNITAEDIQKYIADFINSFEIGDDLPISWLWGTSLCKTTGQNMLPSFSVLDVQAAIDGGSMSKNDIVTKYNEVVQCLPENVKVVET